jgi:hypothetical protein
MGVILSSHWFLTLTLYAFSCVHGKHLQTISFFFSASILSFHFESLYLTVFFKILCFPPLPLGFIYFWSPAFKKPEMQRPIFFDSFCFILPDIYQQPTFNSLGLFFRISSAICSHSVCRVFPYLTFRVIFLYRHTEHIPFSTLLQTLF